jgi:protein ImuB
VARTACVDLPDFPLQLLLRAHPDWRKTPVAVVADDRPQAEVQWASTSARACGVLPGLRFAAALSLAPGLHAAPVPAEKVTAEVSAVAERLRAFTPSVEPSPEVPGVFWLDASGLTRLWPSLAAWGEAVLGRLREDGFTASLAVGFHRFGCFAVARNGRGLRILASPQEERRLARETPLLRLQVDPRTREVLDRLGIVTVGQLGALPLEGVARRFSADLKRLHRMASGELRVPLSPERPEPPPQVRRILDDPVSDAGAIVALVEDALPPLLEEVRRRGRRVAELHLGFLFDRLGEHAERLRPAEATVDPRALLELVRLRLEALQRLPDRVQEVRLLVDEVAAGSRQEGLLPSGRKREREAAERGLARVRASLGLHAVVRAALRDAHLPEVSFTWEAFDRLPDAAPGQADAPSLIRRLHHPPEPLPFRPKQEPDGWMLRGLDRGPVDRIVGPFVISGGWWVRPVHRVYHFAETKGGERLWVYYDREQRRWFLQGSLA